MKTLKLALLPCAVLCLVTISTSFGDDSGYPAAPQLSDQVNSAAQPKLWFFLGADVGYTHLSTSAVNEENLSGSQADVKGLVSYYGEKVVVDAGGGWFFNHLSGNEAPGAVTINTRSPFAELGARYRFDGGHWQLGPVVNITFGSDMSLTPFPTNSTNVAVLAGLQLDCEVNPENPKWRFRFIARAINSIGLADHSLFVGQGGFQIGLPLTPAPEAVAPAQPALAEATAVTTPEVETEVKPVVQIVLGHEFVHFGTASAKLTKKSRVYLNAVGRMLAEKDEAWQLLEISGHTDNRGSHAFNFKLSTARANSVRAALTNGGANGDKITAKGYAFDKPVDPSQNEAAWAKNRRVEMNFMKASQPEVIKDGMDEVKAKLEVR